MTVLANSLEQKSIAVDGIRYLLPDTSSGTVTKSDRHRLINDANSGGPLIILTHYPMDTLDGESRTWIESFLSDYPVELYLAGHRHFTRSRRIRGCLEIITRGLDPDKAFGGPPGISSYERMRDGSWSEEVIAWPHGTELFPAETDFAPVGWSIHGDPVETVRETREFGLNILELRPRDLDYDIDTTREELATLREDRPVYLSWHLPSLSWDETASAVVGQDEVTRQVDHALSCDVDAFTVHVPQIGAHLMDPDNKQWEAFVSAFDSTVKDPTNNGVRLSIENVHNNPGTPLARESRKFATRIEEYEAWMASVVARMGTESTRIGAHFDVGHARNNGELGNFQPLGDWYARIGHRITGYHIHQVRPHEETDKLTNHRDMSSIYERTVSYAGFFHAWSKRQINRAPLFIEIRIAEERRKTTELFQRLFSESELSR
jgi:sugar phosphate isomerase/epimerase